MKIKGKNEPKTIILNFKLYDLDNFLIPKIVIKLQQEACNTGKFSQHLLL